MDKDVEKVRAPNFSMWLYTQKRIHNFRWKKLAVHLGVSESMVHNYANGKSHPQIMKFYGICEFISNHTKQPINNFIIKGMIAISKDRNHDTHL